MVTSNSSKRRSNPTAPAPTVDDLLPDKPGGDPGLLPTAFTGGDLKVWFTVPPLSDPAQGKETYELFVNDEAKAIATRTWTTPITDSDRYLVLPGNWLRNNDGQHRIYYKTTIYNDAENYSFDLVMTLDTKAPEMPLGDASELTFPSEVLPPNKLLAHYLDTHDDEVIAQLPAYTSPRPWDRITWYWSPDRGGLQEGGVIELDDKNYNQPIAITVEGDLIRDRKDGMRYVRYKIADRAGNVSTDSAVVEINVAATPIPRTLPPPKVALATGGAAAGTIDPRDARGGVTVTIPNEAVIYDGERVVLQFGEPGTTGAILVEETVGPRQYAVPEANVARFVRKSLPVRYLVYESAEPLRSSLYTLTVKAINGPPTIQCDRLSGNQLSVGSIPDGEFANFTLDRWTLISTDQYLRVKVIGVSTEIEELEITVVDEVALQSTTPPLDAGRISKADLQRFELNLPLEVRAEVSFDEKGTWQLFPSLRPTLIR